MAGANYGLLNNNLPQMTPYPMAEGVLKGLQQSQEMGLKQDQLALQQKQTDNQWQVQQTQIDEIKQKMNFNQLDATYKVLGAITAAPVEARPVLYQRGLMDLQRRGVDISDMPKTYSPEVEPFITQAAQLSGIAKEQSQQELIKAQTGLANAQAQKNLTPQLTTSNTVTVVDPVTKQPKLVPMQEAVSQGLQVVPSNNGTTVNVGGENPYKLPTGYMLKNPQNPSDGVVPIPGGPDVKMTPEAAAKTALVTQAEKAVNDLYSNLYDKDGKPNRALITTMWANVPGTEGQAMRVQIRQAIEAGLRAASGAAVPEAEVTRYEGLYMPKPTDGEATLRMKEKLLKGFISTTLNLSDPTGTINKDRQAESSSLPLLQESPESIAAIRQSNLQFQNATDDQIKKMILLQNQRLQQQPTAEKKSLEQGGTSMIGSTVQKYESGNTGAATISSGKGDPGGVSYGTYQLSSSKGTLDRFLKWTGYDKQFQGLEPATPQFNAKWKELAQNDPQFANAQHAFISETHFKPVASIAEQSGLPMTPRVAEAVWSMSVQHGKADMLVKRAVALTHNLNDENEVLKNLYKVRRHYVMNLDLPRATKQSILNRYDQEEKDVFTMVA